MYQDPESHDQSEDFENFIDSIEWDTIFDMEFCISVLQDIYWGTVEPSTIAARVARVLGDAFEEATKEAAKEAEQAKADAKIDEVYYGSN